MDYERLGSIVRQKRKELNLTQEKLAELCGISTAFTGHIERGTRVLSVETLWTICSVLRISSDDLLGLTI